MARHLGLCWKVRPVSAELPVITVCKGRRRVGGFHTKSHLLHLPTCSMRSFDMDAILRSLTLKKVSLYRDIELYSLTCLIQSWLALCPAELVHSRESVAVALFQEMSLSSLESPTLSIIQILWITLSYPFCSLTQQPLLTPALTDISTFLCSNSGRICPWARLGLSQ